MGRMEEQQWSITLGNTLLASIVCLLWYVFGLWEEKDKVGEESSTLTSAVEKKKKTTSDLRNQTMTVFQWPQNAPVLESTLPNTSNGISTDLEDKLKDLGIFRAGGDDDGSQVEGAARRCGMELTKRQVRVSFDTF